LAAPGVYLSSRSLRRSLSKDETDAMLGDLSHMKRGYCRGAMVESVRSGNFVSYSCRVVGLDDEELCRLRSRPRG
jgi:hypothetical protein